MVSDFIMKCFTLIVFILVFCSYSDGQKKHCFCAKVPEMNSATVSCETTKLKNNSKLYWQYDCNRIWLTLENAEGKKAIIDGVDVELFGDTYRLGYHLIKEYKNSLLFRGGCPANGSCIYTLIDKNNGKKIRQFNQLVNIDTDVLLENPHPYQFDFVVYLSRRNSLKIYYVDSKKMLSVPFSGYKNISNSIIPEHQFKDMKLKNNLLTLYYETDDNKNEVLKINLKNKKYGR